MLVLLVGCYAPTPTPGAPCANGRCPRGLVCSLATNTCEKDFVGFDAPKDPDGGFDGAIDAPPDGMRMATLVQQATSFSTNDESISAILAATPTPGNTLVMIGAAISGSLTSVTGGATWTLADRSLINTNIEIWIGTNVGGTGTITITRTNNDKSIWLTVTEWSGLANGPLDASNAIDGTGIMASAGTINTTNANDLLIFAVSTLAPNTIASPTPGTWTPLTGITGVNADVRQQQWYRVVNTAGAQSPAVSQTQASWEAGVVALRIAQ